jgi:hypothetical protein
VHLDRRRVLPRVVDDLADEAGKPVDGQAGTALALALTADLFRPLLREARKAQIVQRLFAVVAFAFGDQLETFLRLLQDVVCHG